jgi:phage repressor protein C with HTH and peptisase S24 domain
MKRLSIVLKKLRESRGMTVMELAEKSNTGNGTIGNIERGANKSTEKTLEKISKALNLTMKERDELFSALLPIDVGNKIISNISTINNNALLEMIEIPLFDSASAGTGSFANAQPIGTVDIPMESSKTYYDDVIAITVKGDSMEPTLPNRAIIVVKRGLEVQLGEIGVFFLSGEYGETVVKRLKYKNGTHVLESDNSFYKDILISSEEVTKCGKVIKIVIDNIDKKRSDSLVNKIENLNEEQRKMIEAMMAGFEAINKNID